MLETDKKHIFFRKDFQYLSILFQTASFSGVKNSEMYNKIWDHKVLGLLELDGPFLGFGSQLSHAKLKFFWVWMR